MKRVFISPPTCALHGDSMRAQLFSSLERPGKSLDEVRLELDRRAVRDAKLTSVKRDLIGWRDAKETATETNRIRLLNAPVQVGR